MDAYAVVPVLDVSDLAASLEWFAALGWTTTWTDPDDDGRPGFAAVQSGRCQLFLCRDGQGGRDEGGAWLAVFVADVDAVAALAARVGAEVLEPPEERSWGVREMRLRHPDGHVLRVIQEH